MNPLNLDSVIDFLGGFFSEVPPQALAIVISLVTIALYLLGGIIIASIVGFLALGITHSGFIVFSICALIVAIAAIYGFIKAMHNYRNIMLSYENKKV